MSGSLTPVSEALDGIRNCISPRMQSAELAVKSAIGHVLAQDVVAQHPIPRFDNSAMDGYAFQRRDLDGGQRSFPVAFEVRPENTDISELSSGSCARIMTGSPIPPGADQIIPVEMVDEADDRIEVNEIPSRNPIRPQGEGYAEGERLLEAGTVIRPYEIGLMIESGNETCSVIKPIKIALQVTGSEIDEENDTNGPVLEALMSGWPGVEVSRWPVLGDYPQQVEERLLHLKESADFLVTTGGISAGQHDYLYQTMDRMGAECVVRKVAQKPGKPFTFSMWGDMPVCHLPGNPVSAVFSAECYARVVIATMLRLQTRTVKAATDEPLNNHRKKTLFVTGHVYEDQGSLRLRGQDRMRSHLMQLYTGENVYVNIPPESDIKSGNLVECIPFSTERWFE